MKKVITVLFLLSFMVNSSYSQIPNFARTCGDGNFYGYTLLKGHPGANQQETYSSLQYGIGNYFATGADLYTCYGDAYWGPILRVGKVFSPYFGIGAQATPLLDLNSYAKYCFTSAAIHMNGRFSKDGNLFWCANTWFGFNKDVPDTYYNWDFLGYSFSLSKKQSLTPMVGLIHSWKFDQDVDIAAGVFYGIGKFNIYLWGNELLMKKPKVVVGLEFNFSTK